MQTRYKFLRARDGQIMSNSGEMAWTLGEWNWIQGNVVLCQNGLHCSKEPLDAFRYVKGEVLAIVECSGQHLADEDKEAWDTMRIIKAWRWKKEDSVALAIYSARLVLDLYEKRYPDDARPRKAIEAAESWLKDPSAGAADADAADAAAYAADAAAYAAAYAAGAAYAADAAASGAADAAASAAADAAASAAAAAAADAASASASGAREQIRAKISQWIVDRLDTLELIGEVSGVV